MVEHPFKLSIILFLLRVLNTIEVTSVRLFLEFFPLLIQPSDMHLVHQVSEKSQLFGVGQHLGTRDSVKVVDSISLKSQPASTVSNRHHPQSNKKLHNIRLRFVNLNQMVAVKLDCYPTSFTTTVSMVINNMFHFHCIFCKYFFCILKCQVFVKNIIIIE